MKTFVICLLFILIAFASRAQEVTKLEEATIRLPPLEISRTSDGDMYKFTVNEDYAGEFSKDAIGFMQANFNIQEFLATVKKKNYDSYVLTFKSNNGVLEANFSRDGELLKTRQRFKNTSLPLAIRRDLYNKTKGWSMVKNSYVARGKGNMLDKELYRIKMKNGNRSKIVKIDPKLLDASELAGN